MSKNLSHLSGRKGLEDNLFEAYAKAAEADGTPGQAEMEALHREFLVGKSSVFGAVSFYDFLSPENRGKKVYLCNGSACLTAGTQEGLREKLNMAFSPDEMGEMCCLGRCHENGAFHLNQTNYSGTDIDAIDEIKNNKKASVETYHVGSFGQPVLTAPTGDVATYYKTFAGLLEGKDGLDQIKKSGLRGRGGAGFPIAIKLEACASMKAEPRYLVCNADEGDPGAYSDRYIMEQRPHALLLGMLIAAYVAKASYGVIYIRAEYPESITAIEAAIAEVSALGWTGSNIMGSDFSFDFKVIKAQGAYICGEETALLSSIEGQRPEVRVRPPYPVQQGLFNQPTVVNNVETLACLPFILNQGGESFAALGTPKSKGTKLVSLDGHFNRPGIYEVEMGTPLRLVVDELGQGFRHAIKAMHIGGPLGGLVPVHKIDDLNVDFESFATNGFLLGHASVVCIPEDFPMIAYIEHLFRFTAHESCGKCFPCRLGSTRGYEMIDKSRNEDLKMDRTLFNDLLETLEVGSLCALGGGLPLPVKNSLTYFNDELSPYFKA
ncbi:MAG: NAD(P)H-dependent oxidoreductase subunit E [Saprospiraceae bacterium]|nr:NAD(P)H-dependent oxidoreductase subunit E [Saprospiraceae bacterium]